MLYGFAKILMRIVLAVCLRVKVSGKENVPREGAFILAVNHKSNYDPVVAAVYCPRQLTFMAKEELFENPVFGRLIKRLGAFPVSRGFVGEIPDWAADTDYFRALVKDGKISLPASHKDRDVEAAQKKRRKGD